MTVVEQLHLLFGTEAALRSLKANNVELVKKKNKQQKRLWSSSMKRLLTGNSCINHSLVGRDEWMVLYSLLKANSR